MRLYYSIFAFACFYKSNHLGLLKMLRDSAMERFLTTPVEESEKVEQVNSLNARLSANEAVIAKLEKELNDAIADRDLEVCQRSFLNWVFVSLNYHICRLYIYY
jgi:hypothetical protein